MDSVAFHISEAARRLGVTSKHLRVLERGLHPSGPSRLQRTHLHSIRPRASEEHGRGFPPPQAEAGGGGSRLRWVILASSISCVPMPHPRRSWTRSRPPTVSSSIAMQRKRPPSPTAVTTPQ